MPQHRLIFSNPTETRVVDALHDAPIRPLSELPIGSYAIVEHNMQLHLVYRRSEAITSFLSKSDSWENTLSVRIQFFQLTSGMTISLEVR